MSEVIRSKLKKFRDEHNLSFGESNQIIDSVIRAMLERKTNDDDVIRAQRVSYLVKLNGTNKQWDAIIKKASNYLNSKQQRK